MKLCQLKIPRSQEAGPENDKTHPLKSFFWPGILLSHSGIWPYLVFHGSTVCILQP